MFIVHLLVYFRRNGNCVALLTPFHITLKLDNIFAKYLTSSKNNDHISLYFLSKHVHVEINNLYL